MKGRLLENVGFTLVELLIVIALIGVLAVALVATLNPIEQVNKARDARFKNDAAEVLAAIERYYATQGFYPWEDEVWGDGSGAEDDVSVGLTSRMPGLGVCYGTTYNTEVSGNCVTSDNKGELIETDELKASFANKEPFTSNVTDIDRLYLWKEANTTAVYVCFIPKASSNRKLTSNLYDLGISTTPGGVPSQMEAVTDQATLDMATWADATNSYFKCVPE